ncbi:interleukin-23 receptor [Microcaecilia unicolor]|uniref:Interleukin-23 receptor n=1 Tax=Microcaecilia unicolor TaxID=1415580 RepID=A0A6P7YBW3_9AMPH|nr:interleukin-23 receptor [Microcaecilia unicolor]
MNQCLFCWEVALVLHILFCKSIGGILDCSGFLWTEPAPVVLMGSNISIFCTSTKHNRHCSQGTFVFSLNNKPHRNQAHCINDTTAQLQLHNVEIHHYTVICEFKPNGSTKELVCGMTFSLGYPPDNPTNLTCVLHENSSNMTCIWNTGKYTFIETNYTVHLRSPQSGPHTLGNTEDNNSEGNCSLQTNEERLFLMSNTITINKLRKDRTYIVNITIPINTLQKDREYIVWIEAQNALGMATSNLLQFQLNEIVIPAAPVITKIETIDNSTPHAMVHWENKTSIENVHCEIRYRAAKHPTWSMVEGDEIPSENRLQVRQSLEPYTEYEFQAHCRQTFGRKYWSEWSASFKHTTPESALSEMLDVWRFFGTTYRNGSQELTVFIKPFTPDVSRGRILKYEIFYEDQGYKTTSNFCSTSELQCKIVVPQTVHTVNVIAYNSQGPSKPAKLPVELGYNRSNNLPSPRNMRVISTAQNGILITWESLETSVLWFIVEWISIACDNQQEHFSWKKVPKNQTSTYIQEFTKPGRRIRISLYAIYPNGISKPCADYGFSVEDKPIKGPDILQQRVAGDKVHIEWEDIPVCKQRGFITNYTIYLRNDNDSYNHYVVDASMKWWIFENLSPGVDYAVYITASTAAGEGPQGTIRVIRLDQNARVFNDTTVLVGVVLAAPVLVFVVMLGSNQRIRKRIQTVLLPWMPTWFLEDFPNMKNSTAITSLKAKNECVSLSSILPIPFDEDPIIMEVQETVVQEEHNSNDTDKDHKSMDNSENTLLVDTTSTDLPEQANGYKPQISDRHAMKSLAHDSNRTPHAISDTVENVQSLENLWSKSDTSPRSSLWNSEFGNNTCNFSEREVIDPLSLMTAKSYVPLEHKWEKQFSGDSAEEQTLLPDEMVVCLTSVNEEPLDTKSYFTQVDWNVFQKEIISVK